MKYLPRDVNVTADERRVVCWFCVNKSSLWILQTKSLI